MEQSSWEVNMSSPSQEIYCILWNLKVHYHIEKHLPRVSSWARSIQPMPPHPTSEKFILILSSCLCLTLARDLFHSGLPTKVPYASLLSPIDAICPTHLILLGWIIRKIFNEEYRSSSSSLCSVLHSPVTLSLWDPNIFLCTLFSNTLSLCSSLSVIEQVLHLY